MNTPRTSRLTMGREMKITREQHWNLSSEKSLEKQPVWWLSAKMPRTGIFLVPKAINSTTFQAFEFYMAEQKVPPHHVNDRALLSIIPYAFSTNWGEVGFLSVYIIPYAAILSYVTVMLKWCLLVNGLWFVILGTVLCMCTQLIRRKCKRKC